MKAVNPITIKRDRDNNEIHATCGGCGDRASSTLAQMVMDKKRNGSSIHPTLHIELVNGDIQACCSKCDATNTTTMYDLLMQEAAENPHLLHIIEGWI